MHAGFLKEHTHALSFMLRAVDVLIVILSGVIAHYLYFSEFILPAPYLLTVILGTVLSLVLLPSFNVYETSRGLTHFNALKRFFVGWACVFIGLFIIGVLTKTSWQISRGWCLTWFFHGLFLFLSFRLVVIAILNSCRRVGYNQHHIAIVGGGETAQQLSEMIESSPHIGLKIVGYFSDNPSDQCGRLARYEKLGALNDVKQHIYVDTYDEIWIALPLVDIAMLGNVVEQLKLSPSVIRYVPDLTGFQLINHSAVNIAGMPVVNLSASPVHGVSAWVKAVEDRILALLILILISPAMLCIAVAVKLSSPGPVFFRQERVSKNGQRFEILKFRSMPVDAEKATGAVWQSKSNNRATFVGKFLRSSSLDELPQFINVLRGDMSIVGPRPERPVFVDQFKSEIPGYMQKHLVKAGITGWAQVNGWRGETDLKKRIDHDLYYINNWSLWFDLQIIFLTIFKGFINKNAY